VGLEILPKMLSALVKQVVRAEVQAVVISKTVLTAL
jgi:hypothetical protein